MTALYASIRRVRRILYWLALAIPIACAAHDTPAQQTPRKSQHGTVTQRVASTEIAIAYNRPVARGRALFGGIVPWGRVWCPGADTATTIALSRDVSLDGHTLPAGTYSVWAIPDSVRWTLIFSTAQPVFHVPYPEGHDALRVTVAPRQGEQIETLTFDFPVVDADSAVMRLHWGTTIVDLRIRAP